MMSSTVMMTKEDEAPGLIDFIFSWSLADVMNKDLYLNKVNGIPDIFSSVDHYFNSFATPLLEETHADLLSNMMTLHSAPASEIFYVMESKSFKPPKNLSYDLTLKRLAKNDKNPEGYEPLVMDLIALTDVRPKCIDDLSSCKRSYTVALVLRAPGEVSSNIWIRSSKPILFENGIMGDKLFAVYLTNLTTNRRIWEALHPCKGGNTRIIGSVLSINPFIGENCRICSKRTESTNLSKSRELIVSLGLDDSQKEAVMNCTALTECFHQNSVKLIWGPPGTGKTTTIATLVFTLLRTKCRTLTCAPTNVAVLGVARRLMACLSGTLEHETYGLGDIVLFGNAERMKIDEHEDLYDVFLDHRINELAHCFAPPTGWKSTLDEMICFLEDPEGQYLRYLKQHKERDVDSSGNDDKGDEDEEKKKQTTEAGSNCSDDEDEEEKNEENEFSVVKRLSRLQGKEYMVENENVKGRLRRRDFCKKLIIQDIKDNNKKDLKEKVNFQKRCKSKCNGDKRSEATSKDNIVWTFQEFFAQKFSLSRKKLMRCIKGLYTHLPTSWLPLVVLRNMIKALDMLQMLETFLYNDSVSNNESRKQALIGKGDKGSANQTTSFCKIRLQCLDLMKVLIETFTVPELTGYQNIRDFCLKNACLIFCTVSSSEKLHTQGMSPFKLVIIDEAAQVKECESSIPLQLPGAHHAILVGDEKQLPAMVISKICEKAGFGRSLFERLVTLGQSKHILNVQYRMHPSISLFPNKEFYGNRIRDGRNVTARDYEKRFLKEKVFGSYSFINVTNGKEEFDNKHSLKNKVEVSVIAEIVWKLYKESINSKQKVRIGCISPYKAQVFAIQEVLGKRYSSDANEKFSVNVGSVDGFQGGEEDIIIISTVRCNGNGSVGFLDNLQRANVALTRARYCLWILGDGETLLNSGSIWQKLVIDAKKRGCFYNAYEDKDLSLAISNSLVELGQLNSLLTLDSVLFKMAKWKIFFGPKFRESIARIQDIEIQKEVVSLLEKLSNGWHQQQRDETGFLEGASSQLLKWNVVKGPLRLIWTIEILRENKTDIQVIKVLDILPRSKISQLAKEFNLLFGNNTVNQMNRCLCKRIEAGLMIPMTWPVDACARSRYSSNDDLDGKLASQPAAVSLRDKPKSHPRRKSIWNWKAINGGKKNQ